MAVKDPVPGWTQKIYKGMKDKAQLWGVPFLFGAGMLGGALFSLLWFWPMIAVFAGLHGLAALATAFEPQWKDIVRRHLRHRRQYEG